LVFANELGARGIHVNTILVGVTRTRMLDEAEAFFSPEVRAAMIRRALVEAPREALDARGAALLEGEAGAKKERAVAEDPERVASGEHGVASWHGRGAGRTERVGILPAALGICVR